MIKHSDFDPTAAELLSLFSYKLDAPGVEAVDSEKLFLNSRLRSERILCQGSSFAKMDE